MSPSLYPTIYGPDRFPDGWGLDIAIALHKVKAGSEAVKNARADIMADDTLTPAARLLKLDKLYRSRVEPHLEPAREALAQARTAPDTWRDNIANLFVASDAAGDIALAGEIRSVLRAMSPEDRAKAMQQARQEGDKFTIIAATTGPEFLTGLSPVARDAARLEYVSQQHPEFIERLEAAELFARTAEGSEGGLRNLRASLFSKAEELAIARATEAAQRTARHTAPDQQEAA